MSLLAIDVGEKRIGLAKSDELKIIASPYGFIERKNAIPELKKIVEEESIDKIIVGMPYLPSGGLGSQAVDVKKFVEELKTLMDLPLDYESEVLTSVEAEKRLRDMKREYSKGDIDAMAATIILENYLRRG